MKKLIKILLSVSILFTCFGVNVFADGDVTFTGNSNVVDSFKEYNNVTIESGAEVQITNIGALVVHGTFTCDGSINAEGGAHIVFDDVSQAIGKIDIYDSDGNDFAETPTGFMEFEYNGEKWIKFVPSQDPRFAVFYDTNVGKVYHYVDGVFTEIVLQEGPFEYDVAGEDKLYILANTGYIYSHIEAEDDDFEHPELSIIGKEELEDETIDNKTYKVIKITPNEKSDNFYYFEVKFIEDPAIDFINKLNTLELAFDSTLGVENDYAKLKEYIAHNIYSKYLESGSRYHIENTVFEGVDFDTFKGKVEIVTDDTEPTKTPAQIDDKDSTYFKYKLTGLDNFVGIVYKLNGTDEFVLRDGDTYTIIDVSNEAQEATEGRGAAALKDFDAVSGGKIVVRKINNTVNIDESEDGPNYEIFGNYAGFPMNYTGWMQDFQDTSHISIESVMACVPNGVDSNIFSGLSCEMILYSNDFVGVSIKSNAKAKPWCKDNLPVYPTNSNLEEATVFYASDSVEITTPYAPDSITIPTISNVRFEGGVTSWNGCNITKNGDVFTVTFGSIFYDKVPLRITYSNGTTNSFVLARTGISIGDYPVPGGRDSVDVCGETVRFTDDNKWLIATPFYYDSQSPSRVSLFVRITDNDGNVVTKLVTNTINNSNIHTDDSGYTYNKYDVFELWRGKESDRPKEIEVIAFVQGDYDSFGGVKLGSGNGVKWTKERGRQ